MSGGTSAGGGGEEEEEEEEADGEDERALPLTLHSPASIPRGRNGWVPVLLPKVMKLVRMPKVSVPGMGWEGSIGSDPLIEFRIR